MGSIADFYELMNRLVYKKDEYTVDNYTVENDGENVDDNPVGNQEFTVDLSSAGVTEEYFDKVDWACQSLVIFYENNIANTEMHGAFYDIMIGPRKRNYDDLKFCLIMDIFRCYSGLDHSTSLNQPEGIALLLLLTRLFLPEKLFTFYNLPEIPESVINLDAIVSYAAAGSDEVGIPSEELIIATLLSKVRPKYETLYRKVLYRFCEAISEVDGTVSRFEDEFLKSLLRLDDDDPTNDIEM